MRLVDSHCHLDMLPSWVEGEGVDADREIDQIVQRAHEAGVAWMLNPGVTWTDAARVLEVAGRYPDVYASVGIHPHEADSWDDGAMERLRELARSPKVVAIGECGLDYYYEHGSRPAQQRAFREQIRLAKELSLPLIVHTRDAEADTLDLLRTEGAQKGVLHCFTGSTDLARAALDLGFYISFSGVVTFKKSDDLRATAREVPLSRILIETDAPYLAPPPHRGKRNEPAYVVRIAEQMAEVHGVPVDEIARISTENAEALFGVAG